MSQLRGFSGSVGLGWLQAGGGALHWLESRAGGGRRLVRWQPGKAPVELTPPEFSVGGGVHVYGGGDYAVADDGVWCAGDDGLYRIGDDRAVTLIAAGAFGDLSLGDGELLAVREDETGDALVAIPLQGGGQEPRVLAEAAGFFGSPRVAGGMIAWTWWSARDMPWDGCEVWVAAYEDGQIGDPMRVAGGPDESALEPRWGPDGMLYFMSDRSGWWNLYRHDGTALAPVAAECAAVPWELGYSSYCFLDDGRVAMVVRDAAADRLVTVRDGIVEAADVPYTSIKPCLTAWGDSVALISHEVAIVDLGGTVPRVEVLAGGSDAPQRLEVPGVRSRVLIHQQQPPVIVQAHSGPDVGDFVARGFTVVDVDGYDHAARETRDDCLAVAEALLAEGRATPGQVFIRRRPEPAPRFLRPHTARMNAAAVRDIPASMLLTDEA